MAKPPSDCQDQRITASAPDFACDSFDKHIEKTVEKAKQEVHGYVTGNIVRAGLESLGVPIQMPALEK